MNDLTSLRTRLKEKLKESLAAVLPIIGIVLFLTGVNVGFMPAENYHGQRDFRGGTVIHAKGTGMAGAEKFLGVSIAEEKEMIFMVTKKEDKNAIMQAVMQDAGLNSRAQSIVFSLPVTSTAGMRLEELPPDLEEG